MLRSSGAVVKVLSLVIGSSCRVGKNTICNCKSFAIIGLGQARENRNVDTGSL